MSFKPDQSILTDLNECIEGCKTIDCIIDKLTIGFYTLKRYGRGRPSIGKNPCGYALVYYYYMKYGNHYSKIAREIYSRAQLINMPHGVFVKLVSPDTIEARIKEIKRNPVLENTIKYFWDHIDEFLKIRKKKAGEILYVDMTQLPLLRKAFMEGKREEFRNVLKRMTSFETVALWLSQKNNLRDVITYLRLLGALAYYIKHRDIEVEIKNEKPQLLIKSKTYFAEDIRELPLEEQATIVNDLIELMIRKGFTSDYARRLLTLSWKINSKLHTVMAGAHKKLKVKGKKKNDAHIMFEDEIKYFIEHYHEHGFSKFEAMVILTHITLGCREGTEKIRFGGEIVRGGLLGLEWSNVHWERIDNEMLPTSIDVLETKTGTKGTLWMNCRLDLFFDFLPRWLKEYWDMRGRPMRGRIFDIPYNRLLSIYRKLRKFLNWYRKEVIQGTRIPSEYTPHDSRRTHAYLLILADVPFEIIGGGLRGEKIDSPLGVLWLTDITLVEYYQGLERKALKYLDVVKQKAKQIFG